MTAHRLYILHIQEGTEAGTDSWFHNPASEVSSHLGNPKTGKMDQWVDTNDRAWAEAGYNNVGISVENEGNSGDPLTPSQLENAAQALAWAHTTHGTKLQVTDDPEGEGVIGHGQLGAAGGNHPDCPGAPILAQRQLIVNLAKQILGQGGSTPSASDSHVVELQKLLNASGGFIAVDGDRGPLTNAEYVRQLTGFNISQGTVGTRVRLLQAMLNCHGYDLSLDAVDGPITTSDLRDFQSRHGLTDDGIAGYYTNHKLASV